MVDIDIEKIDQQTIESISVLKDKSATEIYGEKGKNGVIIITTKKKGLIIDKEEKQTPPSLLLKGNGPPPLIIIDGKMEDIDIEKIDQQTIESINVLKDKSATDLYGEKGKNGVILITTKKNKLIIVKEESANGAKEPFVIVEEMPQFPGGEKAAINWISQNMKFPKETVSGKVSDPVEVSFVVTSSGKVADINVNKPVDPSLKDELVKVFSKMPDWKPGMQNGRQVDVSMKLLIDFKKK